MMKTELVVAGVCGNVKKSRPGMFPGGIQSVGVTAEVNRVILTFVVVLRLVGA